jgi:hypothetical protein
MGTRPRMTMAAVAIATAALAACGGSAAPSQSAPSAAGSTPSVVPRSAAAAVAQMKTAMRAATSVHLTGSLSGTGGKTIGLNVGLVRSGGFAGTVTEGGATLGIVNAGGKVYIKATRAFLAALNVPAAVCSVMCGKYVAMSSAQGGALAGELDMPQLLRSITAKLPAFTSAGTQTINGQLAQVLHGADGSTLAVAATGTPYPVEAISPHDRHGSISFSEWNSVPSPVAPPASQVIDLSKLGG